MTQIQVEYFMKTYETRNIAVAADALFISRSAISRAIADLEREPNLIHKVTEIIFTLFWGERVRLT